MTCGTLLSGQDNCNTNNIVQTYYIPFGEDQTFDFFSDINFSFNDCLVDACQNPAFEAYEVASPIFKYVSINILSSPTLIYYDHWEDGFELDVQMGISQATTEIWGDGDLSNGAAPGFPGDVFVGGDIVILPLSLSVPEMPGVIEQDAKDKLLSTKNVLMTAATWATGSRTLMAGATAVLSVSDYCNNFTVPVGEDENVYEMFTYVGAFIQASQDNTIISIDSNADGVVDTTINLDEGETHLIRGGLFQGATITSNNPIASVLVTGDLCEGYESRFFKLVCDEDISNAYLNPVGTPDNGPTVIHLYNPNNFPISVNSELFPGGVQPIINIAANSSKYVPVPNMSGSRYYSTNNFIALATIDAQEESDNGCFVDGRRGNLTYDWGYMLTPESSLKGQVLGAAWAAGQDPTYTGGSTSNTSPIWISTAYPLSSSSTGRITICIDYNGDGGPLTDGNGNEYDMSVLLNELESFAAYDPDGDQTGMAIWVCDGSDALVAAVWGQDPNTAPGGSPAIDVGTSLLGGVAFEATKSYDIISDQNDNGLLSTEDTIQYCICVRNVGKLNYKEDLISILDPLNPLYDYIDGSTSYTYNGVTSMISDDTNPSSPYPLDETGWFFPEVLEIGEVFTVCYQTQLNQVPPEDEFLINNIACVSDGIDEQKPEVNVELDCEIDINILSQEDCDGGEYRVRVRVTWMRPPDENITLNVDGQIRTIEVSEGVDSPFTRWFTLDADGSEQTISASFNDFPECSTSITVSSAPCNPMLNLDKQFVSTTTIGPNEYNIEYLIIVNNTGDAPGNYDLEDTPNFDDDIIIESASFYSSYNSSIVNLTTLPWSLANNREILAGSMDSFYISVQVQIDLSSSSSGDNEYSNCGGSGGGIEAGEGLFNQATLTENGGNEMMLEDEVCADLPYLVLDKTWTSQTPISANCYTINYRLTVENLGGIADAYDLIDNPNFDDNITINSASFTSDVMGITGGTITDFTNIILNTNQNIEPNEEHHYNVSFNVCLEL